MNQNIQIAEKSGNTIGKILKNRHSDSEACVYSIPCKDCNDVYIGETGKNLEIRLKQHKSAYNRCDENNAMFMHAWNKDHRIDWSNAKVILKCANPKKRRILEAMKINEHENFNLQKFPIDLEPTTWALLRNMYNIPVT